MGRYGDIDYPWWAKRGFLLGLGLLLFGAGGELVGHAFFEPIPAWEDALFTYSEGIGILIGFCSPWIFGVLLPLTE